MPALAYSLSIWFWGSVDDVGEETFRRMEQ